MKGRGLGSVEEQSADVQRSLKETVLVIGSFRQQKTRLASKARALNTSAGKSWYNFIKY